MRPGRLLQSTNGPYVGLFLGIVLAATVAAYTGEADTVYENRLRPLADPPPILADHPEFVEPVTARRRFEAPPLIDEPGADLSVRAWRFSYNARGIVELPNRLRSDRTAVIVVHPWGIDDSQGWRTPEPAGVALFCTVEKNRIYHRHAAQVVNPFLQRLRGRVALVGYSLPGSEDPIRRKLYRSVRSRPTDADRRQGRKQLQAVLAAFPYRGEPLVRTIRLTGERPVTADYFAQFGHTDASARYNGEGFWNLPIPIVDRIDVDPEDVVFYDADGYAVLRDFLKQQGVRHVLLAGYATDMCVCSTTAGYENLQKDFNVFLVGDATLATFPASRTPKYATRTALCNASLRQFITQVSWVEPDGDTAEQDAADKPAASR